MAHPPSAEELAAGKREILARRAERAGQAAKTAKPAAAAPAKMAPPKPPMPTTPPTNLPRLNDDQVMQFRGEAKLAYDHAARRCSIEGRGIDGRGASRANATAG